MICAQTYKSPRKTVSQITKESKTRIMTVHFSSAPTNEHIVVKLIKESSFFCDQSGARRIFLSASECLQIFNPNPL